MFKECLHSEITAKNAVLWIMGSGVDINLTAIKQALSTNKSVFLNLHKWFQIALTISISSATCKKSFSVIKKIKTHSEYQCFGIDSTVILYIKNIHQKWLTVIIL